MTWISGFIEGVIIGFLIVLILYYFGWLRGSE